MTLRGHATYKQRLFLVVSEAEDKEGIPLAGWDRLQRGICCEEIQNGQTGSVVDAVFDACKAWISTGTRCTLNFKLEEVSCWTKELILSQWASMSTDEILFNIVSSEEKVLMKRDHTPRDKYVAKLGHKLLTYIKQTRDSICTCVEYADDPNLLRAQQFIGLYSVTCMTFDVVSGDLVQFSVLQWLHEGFFRTHSLILCGDAGLGKTPLGMAMLSEIASQMQEMCPWNRPYFVKVSTVEGLRDALVAGMIKSLVPLMFDDMSPEQTAGGSRAGLPIESLKHVLAAIHTKHVQYKVGVCLFQNKHGINTVYRGATGHITDG